ncbi:chemotaxis protein CheB [Xylophilus sp.]|uniref:chemotaxis protein CheB n=1 Tax=Xylophilus sp. TaxID=2653893 RepID=UPI0013B6E78D|nr:chemotaxis protein CheB [Xylophilus sp.]KAF1049470.1 MAG: Chemotaxis response regulator protein-glutamate methylesterase of group 2 operon [Xylophilus sp.]
MNTDRPSEGPRPPARASGIELIAIGASAGGVDALLQLLGGLPEGFGLPIVAVLHLPPQGDSVLADVFAARTPLRAHEAADKERLAPGTIYFGPPGYHLLIEADASVSLSCEAEVHYSRPSIDVLFDSGAAAYGPRLAAILLTGANEDGAEGLAAVHAAGGLTVVQDPAEAQIAVMPEAAIARQAPDHILRLADIHQLIAALDPNHAPSS